MNHLQALPLTASQLHLWKSQVMSPGKPLFNQVITVDLDLDKIGIKPFALIEQRMQAAWNRLLTSHPVLSYVIDAHRDANPIQQAGEIKSELQFIDLVAGHAATDKLLMEWVEERSVRSFNLEVSLIDAVVVKISDNQALFYLNMHHLVADAWSTMLVWQTISAEFLHPGSQAQPQQVFSDYILQTQQTSSTPAAEDEPPEGGQKVSAPESRRPIFYGIDDQLPSTESSRHRLPLNETDWEKLTESGYDPQLQQLNKNLFAFALHMTVLAICLHRVSQDELIVIEAPLLGRFDKKWMNTAGNFIEMARFEISLQPSESIKDIYLKCRSAIYATLKTAKAGMTEQLQSGAVHGVLNYITAQSTTAENEQLNSRIQWHHAGHSDAHHPLRLHVSDWNGTGKPDIQLDINKAFFPEDRSDAILSHLAASYQGLISSPEISIAAVPLIQQYEQWSFEGSSSPANDQLTVLDLVSHQFESHSASIAIDDGSDTLSYSELRDLTLTVSRKLDAMGIGHGDRVAVYLPRCKELAAILLGILHSGAAFIPIDINQPSLRVLDILNDAEVACSIMQAAEAVHLTSAFQNNATIVSIEDLTSAHAAHTSESLSGTTRPAITLQDPAYLIYTSGSTGKPKGVVVTHGALMNYLSWAVNYYKLDKPIVMPLFTSIGFDLTITTLFLPLLDAGTMRVFTQTDRSDKAVILDVIKDKTITTIKLTPAHLSILAEQDVSDSAIQQLIVGGEDLKSVLARKIHRHFSNSVKIINEYGPTEATVGCITRVWRNSDPDKGSVPIGLPINNTSAYLLNEARLPQLEGIPGDLYISGPSLASGYWNDNTLSDASFSDNPWREENRLYRTGDLARVVDGELVYLGRKDNQLKINGYRIDLSEIESTLLLHPAVNECVALVNDVTQATGTSDKQQFCIECGLSSQHPDAHLNENSVCEICVSYAPLKTRIDAYFKSLDDLKTLITKIKAGNTTSNSDGIDAVVLLSGGKDSTFTLCKLVDLGLNVCALSLDNGFLSDQAKANIDVVCKTLKVEHQYVSTPAMNQIFADSLDRYSNVCHGCFKTIYTLALKFAADRSISYIFTGLSRGQLFETRLNNELFSEPDTSEDSINSMVLAARRQYHAIADAPNTLLNIREVNEGSLLEKINIIDFYRYCHVEMSDMLAYIKSRAGWVRPPDTGRSTNCLINDVGIHVHKLERGYHNYSLPYSWDVRLGHKQRTEALEELDDDINPRNVTAILSKIGYTPKNQPHRHSYISISYTSTSVLTNDELSNWMRARLPDYMLPQNFARIKEMPLNTNGKIDREALDSRITTEPDKVAGRDPGTTEENLLVDLWKNYVQADKISAEDNFFELGGDSLSAIRCVMQLRRMGYALEPAELFQHPRLEHFAVLLRNATTALSAKPVARKPQKFSSLKDSQKEKLEKLLKSKSSDHPK